MLDTSDSAPYTLHLTTRDPDALPEVARAVFPSLDLRLGRAVDDRPVHLRHDVAGDARIVHHRGSLAVSARATGSIAEMTVVGVLRRGALRIDAGGIPLDVTRPFLYPEHDIRAVSDGYDVDLLALQPGAVVRAARALTGDDAHRLRFTGTAPVSAAAEQYWRAVQTHVVGVLDDPAMLAEPLLRGEALRIAVRALLLTFPNTAMAAERSGRSTAHPAVDAATAFIDASPDLALDLQDIADAVGAEPRALSQAFRRRHGRTPLQYLRDRRFERVQRQLAEADPWGAVSVQGVAARWGFTSTGRFAAEYRQRFGESPSATLRR